LPQLGLEPNFNLLFLNIFETNFLFSVSNFSFTTAGISFSFITCRGGKIKVEINLFIKVHRMNVSSTTMVDIHDGTNVLQMASE